VVAVGSRRASSRRQTCMSAGIDRRDFLAASGAAVLGWILPEVQKGQKKAVAANSVEYSLPPLPYPYDALEPYIDRETMKLHHDKHFKAYMDKLNAALPSVSSAKQATTEELEGVLSGLDTIGDAKVKTTVRNNGGGYYNHTVFFETMSKGSENRKPSGKLADEINSQFGSFDEFKKQFTAAATSQFGSGWAWLYRDGKTGKLAVKSYANQDSPLLDGHKPILGCDVWEHAYYLKYNNRRPEYVDAWWNVVNWEAVEKRL